MAKTVRSADLSHFVPHVAPLLPEKTKKNPNCACSAFLRKNGEVEIRPTDREGRVAPIPNKPHTPLGQQQVTEGSIGSWELGAGLHHSAKGKEGVAEDWECCQGRVCGGNPMNAPFLSDANRYHKKASINSLAAGSLFG